MEDGARLGMAPRRGKERGVAESRSVRCDAGAGVEASSELG
jgi:hypothetical protein